MLTAVYPEERRYLGGSSRSSVGDSAATDARLQDPDAKGEPSESPFRSPSHRCWNSPQALGIPRRGSSFIDCWLRLGSPAEMDEMDGMRWDWMTGYGERENAPPDIEK